MKGQDIVIFPDDYLPVQKWDSETEREYPTLIGGFDEHRVEETIRQKSTEMLKIGRESHFRMIRLHFGERQYYLALQGFLVFDPPLQSRSQKQGSKALYYAANKKRGLLLQYLSPYSPTSSHDHTSWTEDFHLLAGDATLRTNNNQNSLLAGSAPTIKPEVVHQILTENQPSLILLEIKGDPNWFEKWLTGEGHRFKKLF